MIRWVVHVIVDGGDVASDVYVGAFRDPDRAIRLANAIERAADREDYDVACIVRELLPGSTSARRVLEEIL